MSISAGKRTATRKPSEYDVDSGRHRRTRIRLPVPPADAECLSYADRGLLLIICSSLISLGVLLISQIHFVMLAPVITFFFVPFIISSLIYYGLSLCVNIGTRSFDLQGHRKFVRAWRPYSYPSLDIFLPVCGEPLPVLHNTWMYVDELVRSYPGPSVVYVLDDGASPQAQMMATNFGFDYVVRPNRGWMKKAGNLRHAFTQSYGDFILLLDADFAPRADILDQILPYFSADPRLGIVQTPQYFRTLKGMSWTERGAAAVQELFYRLIQVSLDRQGGAICVGTCAVYRRIALAVNGGTTLIEHSEDIHTGFDLNRAGWGLRYIPIPLSTGLCPSDPDSFLIQQYRWCMGSMSLIGSRKFWSASMSLRVRCGYLAGFFYYINTAFYTFIGPAISLVLLIALPRQVELGNYSLIMPSIAYNAIIFPAWHRCRYGSEAFMVKLLYGWAHLFVLWDICRRKQLGWQTTGSSQRKAGTRRIWINIVIWNGISSLIWIGLATWRMTQYGAAFIPMLVTGVAAFAITAMALASRHNSRRYAADLSETAEQCLQLAG